MRNIFCVFLVVICVLSVTAKNPDWFIKLQKLQKFPSTEKDVEKLFNSPKVITVDKSKKYKKSLTKTIEYQLIEGKFEVFYSGGKCSESNTEGFDLDDGVILSYYFQLEPRIEMSKLKINLNNFRPEKEFDTEFRFFYSFQKGVRYSVLENVLTSIEFSLPDKYYKNCEDLSKK